MTKEEISYPMVSLEDFIISYAIDTIERSDVATADITRAFIQIDMEGKVQFCVEGVMEKNLVKIDTEKYYDKAFIGG